VLKVIFLTLSVATHVVGGDHWRIETKNGPVHIYRPDRFDPSVGGTVVYVHGFHDTADTSWRDHKLAEQFAESNKQALFIVPEAPVGPGDEVRWARVGELLNTVHRATGLRRPAGPLVVMGHSAAYRTISSWLDDEAISHVILVDALYGNEDRFLSWLDASSRHRLTIVAEDTIPQAEPFVSRVPGAVTLSSIPPRLNDARRARVVYMRSQLDHMALVTSGKALPVLLQRTPLPDRARYGWFKSTPPRRPVAMSER
jgi:hypothetical protein